MLKLLLVVVVFAAVTYAALRLMDRGRASGSSGAPLRRSGPRGAPGRPVAPDDDEEFLRDLDRKRPKDSPD